MGRLTLYCFFNTIFEFRKHPVLWLAFNLPNANTALFEVKSFRVWIGNHSEFFYLQTRAILFDLLECVISNSPSDRFRK